MAPGSRLEIFDTIAARITNDYTSAVDTIDFAKTLLLVLVSVCNSDRASLAGFISVEIKGRSARYDGISI